MVFDYTVKYNGKRYKAGENVPMDEPKKVEPKVEIPVENPIEKAKEMYEQIMETEKRGRGRRAKQE